MFFNFTKLNKINLLDSLTFNGSDYDCDGVETSNHLVIVMVNCRLKGMLRYVLIFDKIISEGNQG